MDAAQTKTAVTQQKEGVGFPVRPIQMLALARSMQPSDCRARTSVLG